MNINKVYEIILNLVFGNEQFGQDRKGNYTIPLT